MKKTTEEEIDLGEVTVYLNSEEAKGANADIHQHVDIDGKKRTSIYIDTK